MTNHLRQLWDKKLSRIMQFTLATIFLIFFNVAASLALCGPWGLWVSASMLLAALALSRIASLWGAIATVIILIFVGVICPGFILSSVRDTLNSMGCAKNLKMIGLSLHNYYDANRHFPSANTCDVNGKPIFSWRVEILPMMEYGNIYALLKKNESWNSPHNIKLLSQIPEFEFRCPSAMDEKNSATNYMAIIGPGTAWREDGPVNISDLPNGSSHTVMAVEVVNSGVHWAEPRDLTVDEALEGLKTGKGLRISTAHPYSINILSADGSVRSLPAKMPLSLWKKILAGEIDFDNNKIIIDPNAPDMVNVSTYPEPSKWPIILGVIVWLFSVVLLFRRAIKSRRKAVVAEVVG